MSIYFNKEYLIPSFFENFQFSLQHHLVCFHFLSSSSYSKIKFSNIKLSDFLHSIFFFIFVLKIYYTYSSIPLRFPILLQLNYVSLKMYGLSDNWSQIMCTVRNYRHYDCPAKGILNCDKVLRNWKTTWCTFRRNLVFRLSISKSNITRCLQL